MKRILQTLLVTTSICILTSCGKTAPINAGFRRSSLDSSGLVLQVRNTSSGSLSCQLYAANHTQNQATRYNFDLGPNSTKEIGILETGWSFKTGESVEISVEGYSTSSFKVP